MGNKLLFFSVSRSVLFAIFELNQQPPRSCSRTKQYGNLLLLLRALRSDLCFLLTLPDAPKSDVQAPAKWSVTESPAMPCARDACASVMLSGFNINERNAGELRGEFVVDSVFITYF